MKILHIGNYNPNEVDGGIEVVTSKLCEGLASHGYNTTLLCYSFNKNSIMQNNNFKLINLFCPIMIFELPIPSLKSIIILINQIKKADIIHIHYPNPLSTLISSILAKKYNKKYVISIHTHIGIDESSEDRGIFYKPFAFINNLFFLRFALRNARKIITPSPYFLQNSKYTSKFEYKSVTIPNGVDINRFNPSVDGQKVRRKLGIDGKMVLFLGSLNSSHKGKGLSVLMDAFKKIIVQIKNTKLVIVGDGDMKQEYIDYAKSLDLNNDIIFVGRVSVEELPNYYAAADVFVLPSIWYESFGIVLVEAMACGTPVIGSDVGGIPFVIGNAGFLVTPNDVDELANTLLYLLTNEDLAKSVGTNCRKRIETVFTWEHTVERMDILYNNL